MGGYAREWVCLLQSAQEERTPSQRRIINGLRFEHAVLSVGIAADGVLSTGTTAEQALLEHFAGQSVPERESAA